MKWNLFSYINIISVISFLVNLEDFQWKQKQKSSRYKYVVGSLKLNMFRISFSSLSSQKFAILLPALNDNSSSWEFSFKKLIVNDDAFMHYC